MVRVFVIQVLMEYYYYLQVGANMVEYLQAAEQTRPYPCTLVLGGEDCCSQAFTVPSGPALEHDSVVQAVHVCVKCFYVFDINFPKQCFSA